MEIRDEMSADVCQVFISGRFDGNTSTEVDKYILGKVEEGCYNIVLNMADVAFTASAGLRVILVYANKLRKEHSGDLRVAAAQATVMKVFELSGLHNVLKLFSDPKEAIESFSE